MSGRYRYNEVRRWSLVGGNASFSGNHPLKDRIWVVWQDSKSSFSYEEKDLEVDAESSKQIEQYISKKDDEQKQEVKEELLDSNMLGDVDFSKSDFVEAFESDTIKTQTRNDFAMVQQWGIRGFPALIAVVNSEAQLVANGYMEADDMLLRVQQVFAVS